MSGYGKVRIDAFIPMDWVNLYTNPIDGNTVYFKGDTNRGFTPYTGDGAGYQYSGDFRIAEEIWFDFSNMQSPCTFFKKVEPTTQKVVHSDGSYSLSSQTASDSGMSISNIKSGTDASGVNYIFCHVSAAVSNPFYTLAPDIVWDYDITVYENGYVTIIGSHGKFPNQEIWTQLRSADGSFDQVSSNSWSKQMTYDAIANGCNVWMLYQGEAINFDVEIQRNDNPYASEV